MYTTPWFSFIIANRCIGFEYSGRVIAASPTILAFLLSVVRLDFAGKYSLCASRPGLRTGITTTRPSTCGLTTMIWPTKPCVGERSRPSRLNRSHLSQVCEQSSLAWSASAVQEVDGVMTGMSWHSQTESNLMFVTAGQGTDVVVCGRKCSQ